LGQFAILKSLLDFAVDHRAGLSSGLHFPLQIDYRGFNTLPSVPISSPMIGPSDGNPRNVQGFATAGKRIQPY
jgi:hypothetical protein